jgi:hypothetical protein
MRHWSDGSLIFIQTRAAPLGDPNQGRFQAIDNRPDRQKKPAIVDLPPAMSDLPGLRAGVRRLRHFSIRPGLRQLVGASQTFPKNNLYSIHNNGRRFALDQTRTRRSLAA